MPGTAARRSPTSRCTITRKRSIIGAVERAHHDRRRDVVREVRHHRPPVVIAEKGEPVDFDRVSHHDVDVLTPTTSANTATRRRSSSTARTGAPARRKHASDPNGPHFHHVVAGLRR